MPKGVANNPKGASPKLNDEIQTKLLSALRMGSHFESAAAFAGICRDTLYRYLRDGRRDLAKGVESLFAVFAREADKAIAESELRHLRNIRDAAEDDWRASAWVLERRHPERWGLRTKESEETTSTASILVLPARLTPEEYERQWLRENKEKTH